MYRNSNNYTRSRYTCFSPYNNYRFQRAYGEIKDFWSYSVNNLATTDVDSAANRTVIFSHLPGTFNTDEDTLHYILHVPSTEALPTYRLGQERPETFDRVSENVFVESLAIKFVMKIMAPVRVRVLAYFDITHIQRFSFQTISAVSGDLFGLQRNIDNGPSTGSLTAPDGPLATIRTQANGTTLAAASGTAFDTPTTRNKVVLGEFNWSSRHSDLGTRKVFNFSLPVKRGIRMRNPDQRSSLGEHPIVWCVMIDAHLVPLAKTEVTRTDISMCELDGGVQSCVSFCNVS
jgi:hypothetical protein